MKKQSGAIKIAQWSVSILLSLLIFFFLGEVYKIGIFSKLIISLLSCVFFIHQWKKSFFRFMLLALTGIFLFISLEISFDSSEWLFFTISIVVSYLVIFLYDQDKKDMRYALLLLLVVFITWIILGFNVTYRDEWIIENLLNVPFIILLLIFSKYFKLSKLSYILIFVFMMLNEIGSHYTYAEVPFGFWLQDFLGLSRNHYDRIVHFCFGFLFAYPFREVFMRIGKTKGWWALLIPIITILGLAGVYEVIEWGAAEVFGGDLGVAYLGTQGDVWDAQKDIALAGIGAIIAMLITMIVLLSYKWKEYTKELGESFKIHDPNPLGEHAIDRMKKRK